MERIKNSPQETLMDRLSSLHDYLLTHILSFLPINQVIKTCVLSKRWRGLWTSVPNLDFEINTSKDEVFIDRVIARRPLGSDLTRFHLKYPSSRPDPGLKVARWLLFATSYNAREIDLNLGPSTEFTSLAAVLNCRSLEYLTLRARICGPLSLCNYFSLTKLKILNLFGVDGIKSEVLGKLILNCPELTHLCLGGSFDGVLNIAGSKLFFIGILASRFSEIQIHCPNLEIFGIDTPELQGHFYGDMPSLKKACIRMPFSNLQSGGVYHHILRSIRNVRLLRFMSHRLEKFSGHHHSEIWFPTFHRLAALHLRSCFHNDDIEAIIYLLRHLPTLKFLYITQVPHCCCVNKGGSWTSRKLDITILNQLQKVMIAGMKAHQNTNQQEFVKFLSVNVGAWKGVTKVTK